MVTNNISMTTNESLFYAPNGTLAFKCALLARGWWPAPLADRWRSGLLLLLSAVTAAAPVATNFGRRVESKEGVFSGSKTVSDAAGTVLLRAKKSPLSRAKWALTDGRSGGVVCKTRTISGMVKIAVEASFPGRRESLVIAPNMNDLSRRVCLCPAAQALHAQRCGSWCMQRQAFGAAAPAPARSAGLRWLRWEAEGRTGRSLLSCCPPASPRRPAPPRRMVMWQAAGKGEAAETPLAEAAYGQNVVLGMLSTLVQNWTYNVALAPGAGAGGWAHVHRLERLMPHANCAWPTRPLSIPLPPPCPHLRRPGARGGAALYLHRPDRV